MAGVDVAEEDVVQAVAPDILVAEPQPARFGGGEPEVDAMRNQQLGAVAGRG